MQRVWTSYSARHAAQLIGLPESAIRSCIRDGLVGTPGTVPAQLTFRDLSALRTVKALVDAGLSLPRVRRELVRIQLALPDGTSLAELTIEARGGQVHIRGHACDMPGQLAADPRQRHPGVDQRLDRAQRRQIAERQLRRHRARRSDQAVADAAADRRLGQPDQLGRVARRVAGPHPLHPTRRTDKTPSRERPRRGAGRAAKNLQAR